MEDLVIKGKLRNVIGKHVKTLRREGLLPAVIYGRGFKPLPITLDFREASHILPTITSSHLVNVEVDGQPHTVLVRERQRHPISGLMVHVDFLEVSMTERLRAMVMLELYGDAPAIKNFNGVLVTGLERIEVEALPRDLPERITIDISNLKEIGNGIYVKDILLSSAVEILTDPEEMIVLVTMPEAEAAAEEIGEGFAEPEIFERGKREDEDY